MCFVHDRKLTTGNDIISAYAHCTGRTVFRLLGRGELTGRRKCPEVGMCGRECVGLLHGAVAIDTGIAMTTDHSCVWQYLTMHARRRHDSQSVASTDKLADAICPVMHCMHVTVAQMQLQLGTRSTAFSLDSRSHSAPCTAAVAIVMLLCCYAAQSVDRLSVCLVQFRS